MKSTERKKSVYARIPEKDTVIIKKIAEIRGYTHIDFFKLDLYGEISRILYLTVNEKRNSNWIKKRVQAKEVS